MMHPQSHSITSPPPPAPTWEPIIAATDGIEETPMPHSDYNLQPLLVQGLDHYVITAGEDERFFVR